MKTTTLPTTSRRARLAARTLALLAVVTAAGGVVTASLALASGSLSITPGIVEHTASPGGIGAVKIANTTGSAMKIQLAIRPWVQSASGEVSPNRGRALGEVRPTTSSFTLASGASRTVGIVLTRTPSARSQYGAVEVTGTPTRRVTNGINVAYRLISSLRLDAPRSAQVFRAQAGGLVEQGNVRHGTLLLAVRNTGNTISPIGGRVSISGAGHALRVNATSREVVPGAMVNLPLTQLLGSLPKGRYTVTVSLTQAGRSLGTVSRAIGLR